LRCSFTRANVLAEVMLMTAETVRTEDSYDPATGVRRREPGLWAATGRRDLPPIGSDEESWPILFESGEEVDEFIRFTYAARRENWA
jgi:hypothetical protein